MAEEKLWYQPLVLLSGQWQCQNERRNAQSFKLSDWGHQIQPEGGQELHAQHQVPSALPRRCCHHLFLLLKQPGAKAEPGTGQPWSPQGLPPVPHGAAGSQGRANMHDMWGPTCYEKLRTRSGLKGLRITGLSRSMRRGKTAPIVEWELKECKIQDSWFKSHDYSHNRNQEIWLNLQIKTSVFCYLFCSSPKDWLSQCELLNPIHL